MLDPDVAAVRGAVAAAVSDLAPGSRVLVACSGGPDSLALAAATAVVARGGGLLAGAVIVDHRLLPGSAAVAARAAEQCRGLGLDPVVVSVSVTGEGGPEAAARQARYQALAEVAEQQQAAAVLLGHTLDDQAETVLLGLARGSGPRSLAGMAAARGLLRRPLLALRREQTVRACRAQLLEPWADPSNGPEATPRRSQVRHRVLPVLEEVLGPGVAEALARTAELAREDADLLDDLGAELLVAAQGPDGLDVQVLSAAPAAVRRRALRAACLAAGAPAGALARVHVLEVDSLLTSWRGQGPISLPGGVRVARRYGRLTLTDGGVGSGPE